MHDNSQILLHYFAAREFGPTAQRNRDWWPDMAPDLLARLDVLRGLWRAPIRISPAARALGRHDGADVDSDHNVDVRGRVEAVDAFPQGLSGAEAAHTLRSIAERVGLGSLGIYPDWSPSPGAHFGIRPGAGGWNTMALWGYVDGSYTDIHEAIKRLRQGEM